MLLLATLDLRVYNIRMAIKNLYIIRHGETAFNKQNIVQGSGVDTDLNETGRNQAALFYKYYQSLNFDVVYTSALKRSQQSVQGFIDSGIKHIALPELNEISWGDFEGKQQTPEQRAFYWQLIDQWNAGNLEAKIPNGESPLEMQARQRGAAERILKATHEQNVLICMHGRAMKSFLCLLLNKPLTEMENFQHTNLCLYQLALNDSGGFDVVRFNDTQHLSENQM